MNNTLPNHNSEDDSPKEDLPLESETESVVLPEPDPDNITVLSHNLPNKPILPWNRYDSLWDEGKAQEEDKTTPEETSETEPDEME